MANSLSLGVEAGVTGGHCSHIFFAREHRVQKICIIFLQRRPNVFDVGATLYKCNTNVLFVVHGDVDHTYSAYTCSTGSG